MSATPTGPALDLDALVAIDVHVHVHADLHGHLALDDELSAAAAKYFKGDPYDPTVPDIAADYRDKKMAAVIFTVDSELTTGHPTLSNEEIAEAAAQHPDVLIPFGSIDPHRGTAGVRAARRLVAEVLPAPAGARRQHPAEGQGAVRLGLPADPAGPLDA